MPHTSSIRHNWLKSIAVFFQAPVIAMLFLGFSAGIPLLLIFSSLSLWLVEAGVERSTVTYFSWAALGYSFKFLWAPLIDRLPIPLLSQYLGRRRSWLIIAQLMVISAIAIMAFIDPSLGEQQLGYMALAAIFLGFSSATQDIVIDAYRIESAENNLQALMSSTYIAGYRIGMLASGAGALVLASYFGSTKANYLYSAWHWTYLCMALFMFIGLITTLIIPEPQQKQSSSPLIHNTQQYLQFLLFFVVCLLAFIGSFILLKTPIELGKISLSPYLSQPISYFIMEVIRLASALIASIAMGFLLATIHWVDKQLIWDSYIAPIYEFFQRYGKNIALILLLFIGFYRVSDIVLGVIANVFFQEIGFTKIQIATVVKTFGLFMTIAGGFIGGILAIRFGLMKVLILGALLTVITNLLFMLLASAGNNIQLLYLVISADNLSAGIASAAFVAYLSSLTNSSFTAVQYAIFSSLMTLMPKLIGGYSGSIVESIGYSNFFLVASLMGIPVLFLLFFIATFLKCAFPNSSKSKICKF